MNNGLKADAINSPFLLPEVFHEYAGIQIVPSLA